jgi:hypothetical protein
VKREGATFSLYTADTREAPAKPRMITALPAGSEYVAWQSPSRIITGQDSKLLLYDTASGGSWMELTDLSAAGVTRISRLAIGNSTRGQWIAIVAEPPAP